MSKKRAPTIVFAGVICCVVLFVIGIGFGFQETSPFRNSVDNTGPLMERVNVVAPKFGHAPVRAATVATCKDVLRRLPPKIYKLLEDGGASINLAPNIEDNWPGSGDGARPGPSDMTMGEESGRCYDRAVWLYESEKVRGSQELRPPRSQDEMRRGIYQLLGHAINDCLGVITKKEELTKLYYADVDSMSPLARTYYLEETQKTHPSTALGCSEIIGILIGGQGYHAFPQVKCFPRTTVYLKKELGLN